MDLWDASWSSAIRWYAYAEKAWLYAAQLHTLGGFSAHAGQSDLLNWFSAIAPSKPRLFLTHGENRPRQIMSALIQKRFHQGVHTWNARHY